MKSKDSGDSEDSEDSREEVKYEKSANSGEERWNKSENSGEDPDVGEKSQDWDEGH